MCGGGEFRVFQFRLGNDPEEGRYRYFRRECKANSNNLAARYPKLSAIDVTEKAFFERLYLVLGLLPTDALGELSVCSHTVYPVANSRFPCKFLFSTIFTPHFCSQLDLQVIWLSHGTLFAGGEWIFTEITGYTYFSLQ